MSLNLAHRESVLPTNLITPISSHTNSVTAMASAQEMCAILEAYWQLSAKRLTDNMCMLVDREILGKYALNNIPCHENISKISSVKSHLYPIYTTFPSSS
jgi:hypothetical protein